jgi:hypothetical protein
MPLVRRRDISLVAVVDGIDYGLWHGYAYFGT